MWQNGKKIWDKFEKKKQILKSNTSEHNFNDLIS